jgi:hypothetical protein
VVGAGALAAGATIYASNQAAGAEKSAANKSIAAQQQMFDTTQQNLQPYNQSGQGAMTTLNKLLTPGADMSSTLASLPGYQFTLGQGLQSVQSSAAARGLGTSGAALRGAADYTTGLAQSQYGNYVNQLQNLVNTGESAAAGVGNAATATGQGIANSLTGAGNATAAAYTAGGNALSGLAGTGVNAYLLNNMLTKTNGGTPGLYGNVGNDVPDGSYGTFNPSMGR